VAEDERRPRLADGMEVDPRGPVRCGDLDDAIERTLTPMDGGSADVIDQDDEVESPAHDNSVGRLLALSDGVFAIAMTLLALDLKIPDLGDHPSNTELHHALTDQGAAYLSYAISFYVAANYWLEHHRLLRTIHTVPPELMRATITVLFFIAALPFPASVLGEYGTTPLALAFYGAFNAAVVLALWRMSHTVISLGLSDRPPDGPADVRERWGDFLVFLLCIPAGYVLGNAGPFVLLLLMASGGFAKWSTRDH
jgi:uncharacterized membrane protein